MFDDTLRDGESKKIYVVQMLTKCGVVLLLLLLWLLLWRVDVRKMGAWGGWGAHLYDVDVGCLQTAMCRSSIYNTCIKHSSRDRKTTIGQVMACECDG